MKIYIDTSLLVSLYITDANSSKAEIWHQANPAPLDFTGFHRIEFRNALSLAVFQQRLTVQEAEAAWQEVQEDLASGLLIPKPDSMQIFCAVVLITFSVLLPTDLNFKDYVPLPRILPRRQWPRRRCLASDRLDRAGLPSRSSRRLLAKLIQPGAAPAEPAEIACAASRRVAPRRPLTNRFCGRTFQANEIEVAARARETFSSSLSPRRPWRVFDSAFAPDIGGLFSCFNASGRLPSPCGERVNYYWSMRHQVRGRVALALGCLEDLHAVEPLIDALNDPSYFVRWTAAESLGELKDSHAVGPLIAALKDINYNVRGRAAWSLGELKDPVAIEPLITALGDPDSNVQLDAANALIALRVLGDSRLVEPLIAKLSSGSSSVRKQAVAALGALGELRPIRNLLVVAVDDESDEVRRAALKAVGFPENIEMICAAVEDKSERVRLAALSVLSGVRDQRAIESFITALKDTSKNVRWKAVLILADLNDARAVEPLISALQDGNEDVRRWAVGYLGKIRQPRIIEPLIAALKDESPDVREAAAASLGEIGDRRAAEPLAALLDDDSLGVQANAAESLRSMGDLRGEANRKKRAAAFAARNAGPQELVEKVAEMPDRDILGALRELCEAYTLNDRTLIMKLEPVCKQIGVELDRKGGIREMRRLFKNLGSINGARPLDMHWNGIGDWRG